MRKSQKIHFEISERKILLRIIDVLFVLIALFFVNYFFNFDYLEVSYSNAFSLLILIIYINSIGSVFEMYNLQAASNTFQTFRNVILTTSVTTLLYLLTPVLTPTLPNNRLQIVYFYLSISVALLIWRYLYIVLFASNRFVKKVIFVVTEKDIDVRINELKEANPHYNFIGFVSESQKTQSKLIKKIPLDELDKFIDDNSLAEIVVYDSKKSPISSELYNKLLSYLENGIVVRQFSEVYESNTYRLPIHIDDNEFIQFFPFNRSNQNKLYIYFCRLFDVVFSLIGLLCFLFIIPVIAFLNLFFNKGSFFYKQERVGKNGTTFWLYKLRSMIANAEKEGAVFATANDKRITSFGKILRKTRLDEVPQFYNVLKGDMAIIGPRPERPYFVKIIAENIPLYQSRHVIKPGLTGWAQVNYSYGENLDDSLMKLRYDLYYIKHRSLFLDINIIVKTLGTILFFKGQ